MGKRRWLALLLASCLLSLSACGNNTTDSGEKSSNEDSSIAVKVTEEEQKAYKSSSPENDTDIGLKNIKFDVAKAELTEDDLMVAEYFNHDYIFVNSIEALQRYNKIFDNSLIQSYVYVEKIISYEGDDYRMLVDMVETTNEMWSFESYIQDTRRMIINGTSGDSRFIVGDIIQINGRYKGVTTESVDGVSLTVPEIDVHKAYMNGMDDPDSWWYVEKPLRYSAQDVKRIAKRIFGEDITVRKDEPEDYGVPSQDYLGSEIENYSGPCYVVELDNQSNAKFSKYFFNDRNGTITDAVHPNYEISFSGDYEHFFLFMYDPEMETLTLEYYDNGLNKIWKREFEETTSASYDVTKNNIYLVANNEMYFINIETGENTYEPLYVGNKVDVRKFDTGVLLISDSKSDAYMYVGLDGNMLWKTNSNDDLKLGWNGPLINKIQTQKVDDKIVISIDGSTFYVLSEEDGSVIYNGNVEQVWFQCYG